MNKQQPIDNPFDYDTKAKVLAAFKRGLLTYWELAERMSALGEVRLEPETRHVPLNEPASPNCPECGEPMEVASTLHGDDVWYCEACGHYM